MTERIISQKEVGRMRMKRSLRLGLLIDSNRIPAWEWIMLEMIVNSGFGEIVLVILNDSQEQERSLLSKILSNPNGLLYNVYSKIDSLLHKPNPNANEIRDSRTLLASAPTLKVRPKRKGHYDWIESDDVERVEGFEIDVLIQLGFGILRGGILNASRFGVWSYYYGDSDDKRGGPAGFREVLENRPITCSMLQVSTKDSDLPLIVYKSYSSTDLLSANWNLSKCCWKSLLFLPRKLQELCQLGEEATLKKVVRYNECGSPYSNRLYETPGNIEMMRQLPGYSLRYLKKRAMMRLLLEQWFLMYDISDDISTSFSSFKKIMPPKDRLWADPHIVFKDNAYHIFFEEFLYNTRKGHISLIRMDENGNVERPSKIIEESFHLSYPFVFEWKGEHYMIPESVENKAIRLYKCVGFPDEWVFHKYLLEDISAVDPTLFHHEGKSWLFVNVREHEGASLCDELFLFFSKDPLGDNWNPHTQNPIVSDVRSSRPAGKIFQRKGNIYRPGQDSSTRYGYGIALNKIVKLGEMEYKEETVDIIEPNWDRKIKSLHTINYENGLTVIDAMTQRFKQSIKVSRTEYGTEPNCTELV